MFLITQTHVDLTIWLVKLGVIKQGDKENIQVDGPLGMNLTNA